MGDLLTVNQQEFDRFKDLVYKEAGIFLKDSKKALVSNRLRKRLGSLGLKSFMEYYKFLSETTAGKQELQHFIDAITTNETYFFRNDRHWEFFQGPFLDEMKKRAGEGRGRTLKVWSAASSTGEEPYTIAVALEEKLENIGSWHVQIHASDINKTVLNLCAEGRYHKDRLRKVSQVLQRRYFKQDPADPEYFFLDSKIKNKVKFRQHNLMEPFPVSGFDVVFCRNVMIYFDKESKERALGHIYNSLRPSGYLILGDAEGMTGTKHDFKYVGPSIYQRPE